MHATGSAPYPTRSPRQTSASVLGAASARTAWSASRLAWMSESTAYRTGQASERRTEFFVNAIEQAVDEPARLLGAELLGDLDGFVDRDLRRHVRHPQELVDGEPKDVAVDDGHPIEIPVLGELHDGVVDLRLIRLRAPDERVGKRTRVVVHGMARPEFLVVWERIVVAIEVELIQELERDFAGFPALTHWSGDREIGSDRGWPETDACGSDTPTSTRANSTRANSTRGGLTPGGPTGGSRYRRRACPCPGRAGLRPARWSPSWRIHSAICRAASAASSPRLPTSPPARAQACSSLRAVMTPKVVGTPVVSATCLIPAAASRATNSKCGVCPRMTTPTHTIPE